MNCNVSLHKCGGDNETIKMGSKGIGEMGLSFSPEIRKSFLDLFSTVEDYQPANIENSSPTAPVGSKQTLCDSAIKLLVGESSCIKAT